MFFRIYTPCSNWNVTFFTVAFTLFCTMFWTCRIMRSGSSLFDCYHRVYFGFVQEMFPGTSCTKINVAESTIELRIRILAQMTSYDILKIVSLIHDALEVFFMKLSKITKIDNSHDKFFFLIREGKSDMIKQTNR